MRASRATSTLMAMVGLLAAADLARAGEGAVPTFPPGKDFKTPKPAKMPGTILEWRAVIARDDAPAFKSFEGDAPLGAARLRFGELAYVVDMQEPAGKPPRLLLARFEDGEKFQGWVGWVEESSVIDRALPLRVEEAREHLRKGVAREHPFYERIGQMLPDASREDFKNVTLKAFRHPERGKACFSRPVPAAEHESASRTTDAVALHPDSFHYVYRITADANHVYCLLGPRSEVSLDSDQLGGKFRRQLVGWVDIESLILWTTREAFEFGLERPPLVFRRKTGRPIELYAKKNDLVDWANWERAGRKGDNPGKPFYVEELDPAKAPPSMLEPWNPRWMRYPILSSFPLGDQSKRPAGIEGKWLGYQLCILGSTKNVGASAAEVEAMTKRMNDAVRDMRVIELVLVLEATDGMGRVFAPVRDSVAKLVEDLKKEAKDQRDELEKVELRVGVVLFKDFAGSDYLTKDSEDFFDVMTDKGLADFKAWLGGKAKEAKGGGALAQPFEGIDKAVERFLSLEGSRHRPAAARLVMAIGHSGNHEAGGNTRLRLADVFRKLEPLGEAANDKKKKPVAKVQLHSVMALLSKEDLRKERIGLKKWESQIHALAEKTGGTSHEVDFHNDANDASTGKMFAALKAALDARRTLTRQEMAKIRDLFGLAGANREEGSAWPGLVVAKDRLKEVVPSRHALENLLKGLSTEFFTEAFAVEQIPGESEPLARLKLCILVSDREFLKILTSTQAMAEGLDEIVKKGVGGGGGGGEVLEAKIKRLVVTTMLNAFGAEFTPARVETLMKKTLPQIQREVSRLPVQFGILKTRPRTEEDLKKMVEALKAKAARLLKINADERSKRFFPAGGATGEPHIWLYRSELP